MIDLREDDNAGARLNLVFFVVWRLLSRLDLDLKGNNVTKMSLIVSKEKFSGTTGNINSAFERYRIFLGN